MHRVPIVDSSSESSSLFSSDASSCSTVSTKDSASTDDFTDYIFGEAGTNWYSRYGHSHRGSIGVSSREDMEGEGNFTVLYTDPTKQHRRKSLSHIEKSSGRENDLDQVLWSNPFDVGYGVPFRRSNGERSAQTFY